MVDSPQHRERRNRQRAGLQARQSHGASDGQEGKRHDDVTGRKEYPRHVAADPDAEKQERSMDQKTEEEKTPARAGKPPRPRERGDKQNERSAHGPRDEGSRRNPDQRLQQGDRELGP